MEHEAAMRALTLGRPGPPGRWESWRWSPCSFVLTGYYALRHEPRIARDLRHIATICGLVVLSMAVVRLLANQTWNAELVPVAIAAMILAIAYNPNFALMVTFGLSLLTCLALGTGNRPLPGPDGRDGGRAC